jgi:hypothetical protein
MSIFKKFIAAQTVIKKTPENIKVLPENEVQPSPKVSNKTSTTNQTDEIPHYLQSALDELETAKSNCKKSFQLFQIEAETLIKKAPLSGEDKEAIKKLINHGVHGNFNMMDMNALSKTTMKYLFPLDMNYKAKYKSVESDFFLAKKKFDTAKEKVEKIKSIING